MQRLLEPPPLTIRLVLPLPPSVNNQYLSVGRRRVLSASAKAFQRDVLRQVSSARASGKLPSHGDLLAGTLLGIYLVYFFASPMKRDLDGGLKITLDALGRALGFDDRAVVDLHLTKRIDPLRPRVEVEIETIADWEFDRTYHYLGEPQRPDSMSGSDNTRSTKGVDSRDDDA